MKVAGQINDAEVSGSLVVAKPVSGGKPGVHCHGCGVLGQGIGPACAVGRDPVAPVPHSTSLRVLNHERDPGQALRVHRAVLRRRARQCFGTMYTAISI